MPKITEINQINVDPQKFLDACSPTELREVELLLSSNYYQDKMNRVSGEVSLIELPNN